jgi:hypothetical protein
LDFLGGGMEARVHGVPTAKQAQHGVAVNICALQQGCCPHNPAGNQNTGFGFAAIDIAEQSIF